MDCIKLGRINYFIEQSLKDQNETWAVLDAYMQCTKEGQFWFTQQDMQTERAIFHLSQLVPQQAIASDDENRLWFVTAKVDIAGEPKISPEHLKIRFWKFYTLFIKMQMLLLLR